MKKFYDSTRYECYVYGYKWILRSDRLITDEQFDKWLRESMLEHLTIHRENDNK